MAEHEEVEEHIHHAKEPFDKLVAGTMAGVAAVLAIVALLGQHFNTEKLANKADAADQWSYYQAKNIRQYVAGATVVLLEQKGEAKAADKFVEDGKKYKEEMEKIQEKARDFEKESDLAGKRAERFHLGEVFLEIGIVLSSLAILTKQKGFYFAGASSAAVGLVLAITVAMIH